MVFTNLNLIVSTNIFQDNSKKLNLWGKHHTPWLYRLSWKIKIQTFIAWHMVTSTAKMNEIHQIVSKLCIPCVSYNHGHPARYRRQKLESKELTKAFCCCSCCCLSFMSAASSSLSEELDESMSFCWGK